jgi:hypothetical protein
MAFDEALAGRVRGILESHPDFSEKKMFGGLCFLLGRHMCCGVTGTELMIRVGPDAYEDSLAQPHARVLDFTGRAPKGMVYVAEEGMSSDAGLNTWVGRGVAFAGSLPPKS